ncbi:MAG: hypothetical protein Q7S81_02285 [bacterium]|nr:hypothetical protein [bacterium]
MAIIISEERKKFNWLPFLIAGIFLFVAVIGSYLLFFTEAPLIEKIVPSNQKIVSEISKVNSDNFKADLSSTKKELLTKAKQTITISTGGSSANPGRTNPLLPF